MPWQDPDSGDWDDGDEGAEPDYCAGEWWSEGYWRYYIDIYIPSGPGLAIEIDDFGSHHTKIQVTNDRERQEKIRKLLNCEFVHFAAITVYNHTTRCAKQIEDWVHANTSSQAKQQLRLV